LLSGGEPTLRKDLPDLVSIYLKHNKIRTVSVPTNGLLPQRIASLASAIARLDSQLHVTFNLSIDGFEDTHDRIRGVPGNFRKSLETLRLLRQVAAECPNLEILVNSVICADNYGEVAPFAEFIRNEKLADGHYFEVVRGDPPDVRIRAVPPDALRRIYDAVLPIQAGYLRTNLRHLHGLRRMWREIEGLGGLIYRYRTQWSVHTHGARWPVPCMAGEAIAVVDYDGRMRVCELRDTAVKLADYDYDFAAARNSSALLAERAAAKSHQCDCTHVCFVNTSVKYSLRERFFALPWFYLRYRLGGRW
jgi:Fe-coproporphyrin III synthase